MGVQAAGSPSSAAVFGQLWWAILVAGAVILMIGRTTRAFDVGHTAAVLTATAVSLLAWWLVQRWGLHNLYELVPAFSFAALSALTVSRLFPVDAGVDSDAARQPG